MRRYDDRVEVRAGAEHPVAFSWRGRSWWVRQVVASWVETGAWWTAARTQAVGGAGPVVLGADLLSEREVWRVEADRCRRDSRGVFDLAYDWTDGGWRLVGCLD